MAKNKSINKLDKFDIDELDVNFLSEFSSPDDEQIGDLVAGLMEVSQQQQKIAIELTKLVVEKSTENLNEDEIYSVFQRSSKVVMENLPLRELLEKFS